MDCNHGPYTLSSLDYIAGASQEIYCEITDDHGNAIVLDHVNDAVSMSIVRYNDRGDTATLVIPAINATIIRNVNDVYSVALFSLSSDDTKDMNGKYVYQITFYDASADLYDIRQGVMYVHKNIDKSAISSS